MTPAHLRGKARVTIGDMAGRLRCTVAQLRALEDTELGAWELRQLASYAAALGYRLRLVVVADGGREMELGL